MTTSDTRGTTKTELVSALRGVGLKVNLHTILNWEKAGLFPHPDKVGSRRLYRLPLSNLLTWASFLYTIADNSRIFDYEGIGAILDRQKGILDNPKEITRLTKGLLGKDSLFGKTAREIEELSSLLVSQLEILLVLSMHGIFQPKEVGRRRAKMLSAVSRVAKTISLMRLAQSYILAMGHYSKICLTVDKYLSKQNSVKSQNLEN